jgi:hypothetical protein
MFEPYHFDFHTINVILYYLVKKKVKQWYIYGIHVQHNLFIISNCIYYLCFINYSNKHLKQILCSCPIYNFCNLRFKNDCLSKFQFSHIYDQCLEKKRM